MLLFSQVYVPEQEGHSAHQIFRLSHLSLRDQGRPLLLESWVIVEDLLRPAKISSLSEEP